MFLLCMYIKMVVVTACNITRPWEEIWKEPTKLIWVQGKSLAMFTPTFPKWSLK
jgi:hypothetical protein